MKDSGFTENAKAYQIGFIASRVCIVLNRIAKGLPYEEKAFATIGEGANLMGQIISGSLLIEDKENIGGLSPSQEGISALGSALSVLQTLGETIETGGLSELFAKYHQSLSNLSKGEDINPEEIKTLKCFFEILSEMTFDDIKRESISRSQRQTNNSAMGIIPHHAYSPC